MTMASQEGEVAIWPTTDDNKLKIQMTRETYWRQQVR